MHALYIFVFLEPIINMLSGEDSHGFNVISSVASIITIGGLAAILIHIYKASVNKDCQKKIIKDLIRHLFINTSILEAIRTCIRKQGYATAPSKGTFLKFKFLDEDLNLSRFSLTSSNFDEMHEVSLFMRNYNIASEVTEEAFADKESTPEMLEWYLDDLFKRAINTTMRLRTLSTRLGIHIPEREIVKMICNCYPIQQDTHIDSLVSLKELTSRNRFPEQAYYDNLGLKEVFDNCILQRTKQFKMFPRYMNQEYIQEGIRCSSIDSERPATPIISTINSSV